MSDVEDFKKKILKIWNYGIYIEEYLKMQCLTIMKWVNMN